MFTCRPSAKATWLAPHAGGAGVRAEGAGSAPPWVCGGKWRERATQGTLSPLEAHVSSQTCRQLHGAASAPRSGKRGEGVFVKGESQIKSIGGSLAICDGGFTTSGVRQGSVDTFLSLSSATGFPISTKPVTEDTQ